MSQSSKPRTLSMPLLARVVLALMAVGIVPLLVSVYLVESEGEAIVEQVKQAYPDESFSRLGGVLEAVAARSAISHRRAAMWAFGLAFLLGAAIVFLAHRTLVAPIRAMLGEQRRVRGGGEIDQLRRAFARLTRSLRDHDAMSVAMKDAILDRYRIIEVLGAGAMGTVYRAWDPRLERAVALKTVKIDRSLADGASDLTAQLVREAVTLAQLNHPNIVTIYDAASDGERAFLAMELVEGISLERYIRQERTLPIEQVVAVGIAVARALEAAHRRGVVHQDIKPANILLGKDGSIKVTDFGIAELLGRIRAGTTRQQISGTPGYFAPEVARGSGSSVKSDLFALGVVLYQSLTGRRPFSGDTSKDIMIATVSQPHRSIEVQRPEVPRPLVRLIDRLLAKHPEQRPERAHVVAETLTAIVSPGTDSVAETAWADPSWTTMPPSMRRLPKFPPTKPASLSSKPPSPTGHSTSTWVPKKHGEDSTADTHILPPLGSTTGSSE